MNTPKRQEPQLARRGTAMWPFWKRKPLGPSPRGQLADLKELMQLCLASRLVCRIRFWRLGLAAKGQGVSFRRGSRPANTDHATISGSRSCPPEHSKQRQICRCDAAPRLDWKIEMVPDNYWETYYTWNCEDDFASSKGAYAATRFHPYACGPPSLSHGLESFKSLIT